jgi:hypothetical protein
LWRAGDLYLAPANFATRRRELRRPGDLYPARRKLRRPGEFYDAALKR